MKHIKDTVLACVILAPWAPSPALSAGAPQSRAAVDAELAEVIVTANRRAESVQAASVPIEVLHGDSLGVAGITSIADLQNLVPSLTTASSGQNMSTYMRGVGSFSTDANADSSIAYNIDGVFISRPSGVGAVFFDLERVEVLKGPQGTLYGRNASGGAINLVTRRPTREWQGDVSVDVGNYNLFRAAAALGGPVSDNVAVRLAGQYSYRDGYLSDGYNDEDSMALRASLLWTPTQESSLFVMGEYTRLDGQGSAGAFRSSRQAQAPDPWTGPTQSPPPSASIIGPDDITTDGYVFTTIKALSAELNVDLDLGTLTFIPAYRDTRPETLTFQPGFHFQPTETAKQHSYELRLANEKGRAKWVLGSYFFDEYQWQEYVLLARPIQQNRVVSLLSTRAYAFFGEARLSVSDSLRLIAGLRYSNDRKKQDGISQSFLPTPATVSNYARRTDDNLSWRAGLEYDVAASNMLFATASTGYKAGGFFPSVPDPFNTFKPEKITAYTLGSRNRFLDNRLQVNVEAFRWDYDNKQEKYLGVLASGGTGLLTTNAGSARIKGANIDVAARLGRGTLRVNGEFLDTNYSQFAYTVISAGPSAALGYSPLATGCVIGPRVPLNPAVATNVIDCAGKPLPHAPKLTGSVSYDHEFQLANGGLVIPRIAVKFASSMYLSPDFIASARDDGYTSLDASLTYDTARTFSATAWVRNIGNQAIYSGGFRYPFSFPSQIGGDPTFFTADIRPPRTYGITLRVRLGR